MNVEPNPTGSNQCLIERENLWNDTMVLVKMLEGNNDQKTTSYFVAMGDVRLTEPRPTKEEAIADVNLQDWKFLATFVTAICALFNKKIK